MRGDVFKIPIKATTYLAEEPHLGDGLKATLTAVAEDGNVSRVLHRDRINLDRAKARGTFAEAAGTDPADLIEVRDRLADFLAPAASVEPGDTPAPDPATMDAAEAILKAPDLLDQAAKTIAALGYAGDAALPKLIYLVVTSRLLARPINLVVTGPSAAGKTYVITLGLELFPPEAVYTLTGFSERVLVYTDADLRHRHLFVQEAAALHREGVGAAILRSVAWEGNVAYEVVEKTPDGLRPRRIEKPGPTGLIVTTTGRVEPELETRVLTVGVPDDRTTTMLILRATAARANGHIPTLPDLAPWRLAQTLLAEEGEREVSIPFAERLAATMPADMVRTRRDFTQLLGLVQAHALLSQRQRDRDGGGRIVATEDDYRVVYEIAAPVFGAIAAEGVTSAVRQTVAAVATLTNGTDESTTVVAVAKALTLDKSAASRRVKAAIAGGWLVNQEERRGRPLKLRTGDPLPEERPALPPPQQLSSDPSCNPATVQPPGENAHDGAENDGSRTVARLQDESPDRDGTVARVAERLHGPMQPSFPSNGAENQPVDISGCTVAPGAKSTVLTLADLDPDERADVDEIAAELRRDGAIAVAQWRADLARRNGEVSERDRHLVDLAINLAEDGGKDGA